jgi:hypothetical protein
VIEIEQEHVHEQRSRGRTFSAPFTGVDCAIGTDSHNVVLSERVTAGLKAWKKISQSRSWFLRLGMTSSGWEGWGKLHVNPHVAIAYFYSVELVQLVSGLYLITGVAFEHYIVSIPWTVFIICNFIIYISFWRYGPMVAHHKLYPALLGTALIGMLPMLYVGYAGPLSTVPWNNRLHFVCASVPGAVFGTESASAGKVAGEHPPQPRHSIMMPVLRNTFKSILLADALTDLTLVRTMFEQVFC